MKNIIYIISLLFLFGCSYIDESQLTQNETEKTNVDSFLGLTSTGKLTPVNTGAFREETVEKDISHDSKNIAENTEETIDTQVVEPGLIEIENITIEVDDIVIEQTDEEATIIEESTDQDIEELIDILFETSS